MLSKLNLNSTYLLRNVQWTFCLVRSSTSYAVHQPSQVKFDSISDAYGYKSKGELFRGWFVFKLCSYTTLVDRLSQVFDALRSVIGRKAFSNIMRSTLYGHFVAGTDKNELKPIVQRLRRHGVKLILDYSMESDIASNKTQNNHSILIKTTNEEAYNENLLKSLRNVQAAAELSGSSAITAIKVTAFVHPNILQKLNQVLEQDKASATTPIKDIISKTSTLTEDEINQMQHLIQRIHRIVQEVEKLEGKIFIDAEQTYFQTAIHRLALELQESYNKERVIVYNTYQCYRKITLDLLQQDLIRSKDRHFHIGLKLVRGAYMDQERKRAIEMNIEDPIHPDFAATTRCYHRAFVEVLEHAKKYGRTRVIVASHNEETVRFALETMKSMDVKRDDDLVSFATLFGMCDYLTFPLAAVGYNAYKLAPYGPIDCLLPYLTRRAQENRAIFAKAEKDRRLHYQALKARFGSYRG